MKIVYCITRSDTLGGAHIHVADMAEWVKNKGADVTVVVGGNGIYCEHLKQKKLNYIVSKHLCREISLLHDPLAVIELKKIFNQLKPDLLSLHSTKAGLLGRIAAQRLDISVIFTVHGWSFTEGVSAGKAFTYRIIERTAAPLANKIITVSNYDRLLALRSNVSNHDQLVTVHNGMPDILDRSFPGKTTSPLRITMVARLDEPKDHVILFKALTQIKDVEWQLDLIGDGPHEGSLKTLAEQLGIDDRVNFLGLRRDVSKLLSEAHIFVLTSRWEAFPRSILEAMRSGLPIIASNVGGIKESVEDGLNGFLVKAGDLDNLIAKLRTLLIDSAMRDEMGAIGRKLFEDKFRFDIMAKKTMSVYEEVLGRSLCASA